MNVEALQRMEIGRTRETGVRLLVTSRGQKAQIPVCGRTGSTHTSPGLFLLFPPLCRLVSLSLFVCVSASLSLSLSPILLLSLEKYLFPPTQQRTQPK